MECKTKAVCLNYTNYTNSAIIAKLYTQEIGKLSVIIKGIRNQKSKYKISYLYPFSILNVDLAKGSKGDIYNTKDLNLDYIPINNYTDIRKSSIIFFLSEFINKITKDEQQDYDLFSFLSNSIRILDLMEEGVANFHHIFLAHLTKFTGIFPANANNNSFTHLNISAGAFDNNISTEKSDFLVKKIFNNSFDTAGELSFSNTERNKALDKIINYYNYYYEGVKDLNSLKILTDIFSNQ